MTNVPCYGPYKGKKSTEKQTRSNTRRQRQCKDNINQQRPKPIFKDKMNDNNKDKVVNNNNKNAGYDDVKQEHRTN